MNPHTKDRPEEAYLGLQPIWAPLAGSSIRNKSPSNVHPDTERLHDAMALASPSGLHGRNVPLFVRYSSPPNVPTRLTATIYPDRESKSLRPLSSPGPQDSASNYGSAVGDDGDDTQTDYTCSTLPPSYKSRRSVPDLPACMPPSHSRPPLPTAQATSAAGVSAPPSAFVLPGRRRHRSRPVGGRPRTRDNVWTASNVSAYARHWPFSPNHVDIELREYGGSHPRKSVDGGVRLAGGRLDEV
ncbi:hypothetical protein C8Q77DRAFT_511063 [Trametes polyzona]|nr:hypothetical protein C8Q77DRAFT_511063 [Trametes polyzona]